MQYTTAAPHNNGEWVNGKVFDASESKAQHRGRRAVPYVLLGGPGRDVLVVSKILVPFTYTCHSNSVIDRSADTLFIHQSQKTILLLKRHQI